MVVVPSVKAVNGSDCFVMLIGTGKLCAKLYLFEKGLIGTWIMYCVSDDHTITNGMLSNLFGLNMLASKFDLILALPKF